MKLIDADKLMENKFKNDISYNAFCNLVKRQPSIDAVPVKAGRWIYNPNEYDDSTYECSSCGEPWTLIDGTPKENGMNYCPNCGARMRGEKDETD